LVIYDENHKFASMQPFSGDLIFFLDGGGLSFVPSIVSGLAPI
jgi:hypothetical protein